jgi:hypothetical protein
MPDRPTKISFGEMRDSSVRGLLVYCADYAAATRSRSAVMAVLDVNHNLAVGEDRANARGNCCRLELSITADLLSSVVTCGGGHQ